MYEFDAICIDDESCPIVSVSIMHDPDADTFALVDNARPETPPRDEATQASASHSNDTINWDKLAEKHAVAYLRGDLATSSPESYTIEEMKAISDGMFASTTEVEAALRTNFSSMTPETQGVMLDLLKEADPDGIDWWLSILIGRMPDNLSEITND